MTDVLDRTFAVEELEPDEVASAPDSGATRSLRAHGLLTVAAVLSAAAGVIHLVMVPSHMGESTVEGIAFVLAGWFQLVAAWLLLARPSRKLLAPIAIVNALFIGAWIWSRTVGWPVGSHAWHAESASFIDQVTVGFEAALIVCCVAAARQRVTNAARTAWRGATATVIAIVAIVGLTTAALASPSARDHAAHSHDAGASGDHAHDAGAADAHAHGAATGVDDKGLSLLSNGHHSLIGAEQPLDAATRAQLTHEIQMTQQAAQLYPTIAAAEAAGYRRAGPYSPGLGTHYIRPNGDGLNADGVMDDAALLSPLSIIYAGTDPDSPIAGFMYYSMSKDEPTGFAGPNDHWHYHTNTCIKPGANGAVDAPFGADSDVPAELCEQAGGSLMPQTQWMVHVWSVPGWESQQGLFGEVNPGLTCPDGTYYMLPMEQWIQNPLNVCIS